MVLIHCAEGGAARLVGDRRDGHIGRRRIREETSAPVDDGKRTVPLVNGPFGR